MFAVISRPVARRSLGYAARCMATKPPSKRPTPKKEQPVQEEAPAAEDPPAVVPAPLPSLDILPADEDIDGQRTGAKSSKDSLSSAEMQRRRMGRVSAVLLAMLLGGQVAYMTREWSPEDLAAKKMVHSLHDTPFIS